MYDENEVYDLQRERQQEALKTTVQVFLRSKFAADAEYRPIHLTFESLTALLMEFEASEGRTPLGGCL
jgi:hypothetical protein